MSNLQTIPKIIHQSWKSEQIPDRWLTYQKSWRVHYPDYEYRFWTDSANREFIASTYPRYLDLYDGYDAGIKRADLARYLVTMHFGGIYADMDMEALRPIDSLLAGKSLIFGLEPPSHLDNAPAKMRGVTRIVCNAFFASVPHHPFWPHLMTNLCSAKGHINVLDATGPFALTRAYESYDRPEDISLVAPSLFYPIDNALRPLQAVDGSEEEDGPYAIHHWQGTWWREALLINARQRILATRMNRGVP